MSSLLDDEIQITSVLLIISKKGSIRANHYHKKDTHYSYLISGKMEYTSKNLTRKRAKKTTRIVHAGEIIKTPPMMIHAMRFLEDTVFLALTTESRKRKDYERDTVRIQLVPSR